MIYKDTNIQSDTKIQTYKTETLHVRLQWAAYRHFLLIWTSVCKTLKFSAFFTDNALLELLFTNLLDALPDHFQWITASMENLINCLYFTRTLTFNDFGVRDAVNGFNLYCIFNFYSSITVVHTQAQKKEKNRTKKKTQNVGL